MAVCGAGAAQVSGGVIYRAKRRGVIYAALISPLVAATVAATLVCLFLVLAALVSGDLIELIESVGWPQLPGYFMAFGLLAVIYASVFTYVTASPFLAVAWLLAHRLGWRAPRQMALTMAAGGLIYGLALFGLFSWSSFQSAPVSAVLWTGVGGAAGLPAGLVTGLFISTRAYERVAPPEPGVDAEPG
ncbi:MAG: hypothetical protein LAT81_09995 [Oceanicaulis sp.]|nr:hypothetical protein [Oceanicaulis sp.]